MKCPKCGINLLDHVDVCPFCKTPIDKADVEINSEPSAPVSRNTGRFSTVDPAKESYDFDLQYTLTFRDSGEIKQAIADMEGGVMPNLGGDKSDDEPKKPSNAPRYTLEEMQEAALRAQERRERRNSGKGGAVKSRRKKVSRSEKRHNDALKAAKPREKRQSTGGNAKSHRGILLGGVVLTLVVLLIIGIVNVCAFFAHRDPEFPTVYTKGNELYSFYGGKEELLSANFITIAADAGDDRNEGERSSSAKKATDPKIKEVKALTEKNIVNVSENGSVIYFLENMNMETRAGNLVYYESGKKKSRTVLAQNVYYDIELGKDGASVMYLKNADENGAHGELCYWKPGLKEEVMVESDITAGNFKLSQDCTSVTYIRNFNPEVHTGDLCYLSFAENAEPSKRVDERVAFVFGTSAKGKTYFYAKNYDIKTGTYDLYVQSDVEGPKMLAEKGLLAPVISSKTECAFVYSNYKNNFQTISCVDLATGTNTVLANEMTEIIKVRMDDGAVIYSKAYENEKADYYYVNSKTPNPQTVATAINITAAKKPGISLFDVSDDFSKISYIGGFDAETMKGALYTLSILNDYAGSEMRISDDAYSCDISSDGAVVRFATSYNAEANTVNLVSYSNSNTLALADGVAVGAFTFDKTGDYAVYAKDVDMATVVGKIQSVDRKAKIRELDESVNAYGLKKDGTVLLLKKGEGEEQNTSLFKTTLKGGKVKNMTENISKVVLY